MTSDGLDASPMPQADDLSAKQQLARAGQLLLTPREAAHELAISERKLWGLMKAGEIPAVRIGR